VEKDCRARRLNTEDAMDRSRWRKQIGMIDDHDECEWWDVGMVVWDDADLHIAQQMPLPLTRQWHLLGYMQVCIIPDIGRQPCQHPTTQFFTGRMPFLPPNQQPQSTKGINSYLYHPLQYHKLQWCVHLWAQSLTKKDEPMSTTPTILYRVPHSTFYLQSDKEHIMQ